MNSPFADQTILGLLVAARGLGTLYAPNVPKMGHVNFLLRELAREGGVVRFADPWFTVRRGGRSHARANVSLCVWAGQDAPPPVSLWSLRVAGEFRVATPVVASDGPEEERHARIYSVDCISGLGSV